MTSHQPERCDTEKRRYTATGSDAVEAAIDRDQRLVSQGVAKSAFSELVESVVMIGGYARGEGGYLVRDSEPGAYNDYDYFVVLKDAAKTKLPAIRELLTKIARELEKAVRVEVDFFPLLESDISQLPFTLMYAEMQAGNRVIHGRNDILSSMPAMPLDAAPDDEFKRLLLNRGTLLLFNQKNIAAETLEDLDEFNKFINKAVLAIGDSILHRNGRYHVSYRVKQQRLREVATTSAELVELYERAVNHKFEPGSAVLDVAELVPLHNRVVQLWRGEFSQHANRVQRSKVTRQAAVAKLRNLAINIRDLGLAKVLVTPILSLTYPRELLYLSLPILLDANSRDVEELRRLLRTDLKNWPGLVERYTSLWYRYS